MCSAARMIEERQGIKVADLEHLRTVEVGNAIGCIHRGFIVVSGIVRGVSGGSGIQVLGPGVGRLEITALPASRQRGLQRVVGGVSVVGENLVTGVAIQTRRGSTCDGIIESISSYLVAIAVDVLNRERVRRAGIH